MDSDWVFNVECNQPPTNTSTYFDENIIPEVFYNAVINRNKQQMYTVIKNNPKLSKAIISFFQFISSTVKNFLCLAHIYFSLEFGTYFFLVEVFFTIF